MGSLECHVGFECRAGQVSGTAGMYSFVVWCDIHDAVTNATHNKVSTYVLQTPEQDKRTQISL